MISLQRHQKRTIGIAVLVVSFVSIYLFVMTATYKTGRGSIPVTGGSLVLRLPAAGFGISSAQDGDELVFRFTKSNAATWSIYSDAILWTHSTWELDAAISKPGESDSAGKPLAQDELQRLLGQRPPALLAAMSDREEAAKNYDWSGRWGTYFRQYSTLLESGSSRLTGGVVEWNNVEVTATRLLGTKSFGLLCCAGLAIGSALFFKNAPPRRASARTHCGSCGYELLGLLPEVPCPECGKPQIPSPSEP
jgi:hypothetical protein